MTSGQVIMSVADVQKALGIGKDKAYLLFKQKSFPGIRIDGKYVVITKDFEVWLDNIKKIPDRNYVITRA